MRTVFAVRPLLRWFAGLTLFLSSHFVLGAGLNLYVQPIASEAKTEALFKPLAEYLANKIGMPISVHTEASFLAYWERMRRVQGFDLVLDAAHFTDYRDTRFNYHVLAKFPDTVSFSLVTAQDLLVFDAQDLIGNTIATAASPSLGGVRMAEIYSNPMRQPSLIPVNNFEQALDKLHQGDVRAALVPTPMIRGDATVNTVLTTQPVPHMAFSVSPKVSRKIREQLRTALVDADKTEAGRQMLESLKLARFEPANNKLYRGYAKLLSGIWGYK